jgi:CubicO group peptidase (beta-lactamase class C family)
MTPSWQRRLPAGVICILLLAGTAVAQDEAPKLTDQVDELFAAWNRTDSPGAAIAVIRDGRIIYQNAYGMADLERGVAITPRSAFEIGSISKQFTAMSVLLLEIDGALSIDDDIRAHLPEIADYGETVTIRHLLHHTSGIRDIETLIPLAGINWFNYYSVDEQIELIARQKALNFEPGSRYLYSNSGYLLLAEIVERVSGKPLRDFAEERIFEPLDMQHTVFWDRPEQIVPNRALAYGPDGEGGWGNETWNMPFPGPAGLYTTVGDLALWDANFYDNRLGGGAELIECMETSGVLDDGKETGYAFGLFVDSLWGLQRVSHGGAWQGYRAGLMRFPEQRLSVALLSNASEIEVRSSQIARLYLADAIEPGGEGGAFEPPETVQLSDEQLASYAGRYWSEEAGLLRTMEVRDGTLFYVRGGGNDTELGAVEPAKFFMTGLSFLLEVEFDTEAGTMAVIQNDDPLMFDAVPPPSGEDLGDLVGSYWSEELERELRLRADDGRLFASWADEEEATPAQAIRFDEYLVPTFVPVPWSPMDVRLEFERDEAGTVSGLTLSCEMVSGVEMVRR